MTQNTVPLPEPLCRDDTEHGVNYYTADQMHAHAAKVCAEKDAEIERLRDALLKIERTVYHIERPPIESLDEQMRRIASAALKESK